jgi:hypothetical protein
LSEQGGVNDDDSALAPEEDDPFELEDFFPMDGGELAIVYLPPSERNAHFMRLMGQMQAEEDWVVLAEAASNDAVFARELYPAPGDQMSFLVTVQEEGNVYEGCDGEIVSGEFLVFFDGEELSVSVHAGGPLSCYVQVEVPGMAEYDPEPIFEPEPEEEADEQPESEPEPTDSEEEEDSITPPAENTDGNNATEDGDFFGSVLTLRWSTPFMAMANRITLSGEYRFADGSFGFFWHELLSVYDVHTIDYVIGGVQSGDSLRFSVEFEDANGYVSWSCIGPFIEGTSQQGTVQGIAHADLDGDSISLMTNGDPSGQTTGCGLTAYIP